VGKGFRGCDNSKKSCIFAYHIVSAMGGKNDDICLRNIMLDDINA
jgi:hypothetical protein